jgi:hypothetical protein
MLQEKQKSIKSEKKSKLQYHCEIYNLSNIRFIGSVVRHQLKLHVRPSNAQMMPSTLQIQYSYFLNILVALFLRLFYNHLSVANGNFHSRNIQLIQMLIQFPFLEKYLPNTNVLLTLLELVMITHNTM